MRKISPTDELKNAIQLLEVVQAVNKQQLKEEFQATIIRLKPVNLIGGAIKNIVTSSLASNNILGDAVGLFTGYLTKKIVVGGSDNKFRKILGAVLQFGVTGLVNKNPDAIRSVAQYLFQHIHSKKETNFIKP